MASNKALLPYALNSNEPAFHAITIEKKDTKRNSYFSQRITELQKEYDELVELASLNNLIEQSRYNFEPKHNKPYYLYRTEKDIILSMIDNWSKYDLIAAVILDSNNVWRKHA